MSDVRRRFSYKDITSEHVNDVYLFVSSCSMLKSFKTHRVLEDLIMVRQKMI